MFQNHPILFWSPILLIIFLVGMAAGFYLKKYGVESLVKDYERRLNELTKYLEETAIEERRIALTQHLQVLEELQEYHEWEMDCLQQKHEEELEGLYHRLVKATERIDTLSQDPFWLSLLPGFKTRDKAKEM